MAKELEIKITTKYDQAEKGFNKVTDSVQKYRKELLKASTEGKVTDETITKYAQALSKQLAIEDQTKEGMAALTSQAKILRREMTEVGLAFGEDGNLFKGMKTALDEVNAEMAKTPSLSKKASGGMDDFGKKSDNAALKLLSVAKNILKFQLLMGPITAAIRGFKNTLSDSMKVAAEAEQRFNKLATVFDGFEDSAKRMAITLASTLGVANSTSASALSTVGDLLQAQGMGTADSLLKSAEWVKQFQDIIAFKDINMSLEEFAQNFMSGAAGNLRNFRTFGSIVKESAVNARLAAEGLDKLTGSQLELAKMTTRATMALEQQKNAVGATEREWDTMLSINRRLSEAWKQYKENLGETINSVLRPMKSAWADILDQINKAKKAQEEYNKGNKNPDVYDMPNSASDRASFTKRMLALTPGGQSPLATVTSLKEMDALQSQYYSELKKIFIEFGATIEDVSILMGDNLSDAIYAELKVLDARRKAEKDFLDAQKARKAKLSSAADSFSALQETLLGIAGVNFNPTSITELVNRGMNSDREMKDAIDKMSSLTTDIIKESLDSLDASDLAQTFGDVISRELGELDEADLRQGKADSYRKLFEAAWNAYLPGGIDSEERLALDNIKKSYKEATSALEEYNKKIQRQNALLNANSTIASAISSYHRLKYESGLEGPQSYKDYDMALNWDIPLLVESFAKSLRDAGVELETVTRKSDEYASVLRKEANLKYINALRAAQNELVSGYRSQAEGYRSERLALGLSDADVTRRKLIAEQEEAIADGNNELVTSISDTIIQFDLLQRAIEEQNRLEAQREINAKLNPFTGLQESWKTGETSGYGGLISILADILSQTEAFSELTNLVSDTFVPILDAVMKPLIPMINVVKTIFDLLPWEALFDVFKMVAEVVVAISFPIKIIAAVVKNIYTAVHNILQRIIHPITGGDQWAYESLEKILDDTNEKLEQIRGLSFKIERNTEKDDLATLRELYRNKVISEQQFYTGARVLQKDIPFEALDSYRPSTTVRNEYNITINANDEAGLAKVERILEQNNIPVTHAWAGYSASAVGRYQMAMGGR